MNKITYWLRKVGMLRTSSYKVSGDAEKLNKVQASDGGMMQSQKEIDEKYKENKDINQSFDNNESNNKSASKAAFYILLFFGILTCLFILMMGIVIGFFVFIGIWGWFLYGVWQKTNSGTLMVGRAIVIGVGLIAASFVFVLVAIPTDEHSTQQDASVVVKESKDGSIEQNKADEVVGGKVSPMDKISQFFVELEKETEINFETVEDATGTSWTTGGMGLALQNAKQVKINNASSKDLKLIKKYFEDNDGTHGTVGMVFKGNSNQDGYYFQNGEYKMLMCVMTDLNEVITVSCGWGPGGGE